MLQLDQPATIEAQDQQKLDQIPVNDRPQKWDKSKAEAVVRFKAAVHDHGIDVQDSRCAWCTLQIGAKGRRTAHRDHIAPKKRYPQWTFTPKNLILSCEYCNGFSVKVDLDTVQNVDPDYDLSSFLIVHPYLDQVASHLGFVEKEPTIQGVVIEGRSTKGSWTITQMKLDTPEMTTLRAQELVAYHAAGKLPVHFQQLLAQATGRIPQDP